MKNPARVFDRCWRVCASLLGCALVMTGVVIDAAEPSTAKELREAFESGDSTRCMEAGNNARDYEQFAAELAAPLIAVAAAGGPCADNAISGLINLGPGIRDGVDADVAMPVLIAIVEEALDPNAGFEAESDAQSAVLAIGHFGPDAAAAVPVLERLLLETEEAFSKRYVLLTFADMGDGAAPVAPTLVELLGPSEDDSYERNEVRYETARALGSIPAAAETTAPALVAALSAEDYTLSSIAADALVEIGAPAVPFLITELDSDDPEHLDRVIGILGKMGEDAAPAATALVPLLTFDDWNVTFAAGEALWNIGPSEEAVPGLIELVEDFDNDDAQEAAIEVLRTYGATAKPALPALRKAAKSGGWSVKQIAEAAVGEIEAAEE